MELWNDIFSVNNEREFGFFYKDNLIKFYIPEQLSLSNNEQNLLYLKKYNSILRKYSKSIIKKENFNNSIFNENNFNLEIISSYLSILDDFITNGTFYLFEQFYKKNNKKINWNKTLKENNIIINSESEIVYNSFYSKNVFNNNYHQFYTLYLEALRRSKIYFWGILTDDIFYPKNKNEQKYHLTKYSDEHFKDREIFISNHLKNIYLNDKWNYINESQFDFKYHLKFEHIWQEMINQITKNNNMDIIIEKGKYLDGNIPGINLIQDHFIKLDTMYFLLDSKFYKTYNNNEYPDTAEITKQFTYKYLISKQLNISIESIINCFIFPKNNDENKDPEVFNIHYNDISHDFTIFCIALDVQTVIDLYLNDSNYESFNTLLKNIFVNQNIFIKNFKHKIFNNNQMKFSKFCLHYKSTKGSLNANLYLDKNSPSFHVLKGSTGFLSKDPKILKLQNNFISNKIIEIKDNNLILFIQDFQFNKKEDAFNILGQPLVNWKKSNKDIKKSKI